MRRLLGLCLLAACDVGAGIEGVQGPAPADLAPVCAPQTTGVLSMDVLNCGGCGPTPTGIDRRLGTSYNWHCCAGRPYDAQTDPLHCGTCDTVCPEGVQCIDWTCR